MSSFNVAQFANVPLDARVPESSKLTKGVSVQSVINKRRVAKFEPSSSTSRNAGETITIRVSDPSDFLVPASAVLHFDVEVAGGTAPCIDDIPAIAVLSQTRLRVSGAEVENVIDANRAIMAMYQSHVNRSVYEGSDNILLHTWKWNRHTHDNTAPDPVSLTTGTAIQDLSAALETQFAYQTSKVDSSGGVAQRRELEFVEVANKAVSAPAAGQRKQQCNLPLALVQATHRSNKLFPLSFVGSMTYEITLSSNSEALVDPAGAGDATYSLQDIYLTCSLVSMADSQLQTMASILASPDPDMAYVMPVHCISTSVQNATASGATNAAASRVNFTFSRSTPFMRNILFAFADNDKLRDQAEYSVSGFPCVVGREADVRLRAGGMVQPEYDSLRSIEEIYRNQAEALAQTGNVLINQGLQTLNNYAEPYHNTGVFTILFSFEKLTGLDDDVDLQGADLSLNGSVINLEANIWQAGGATTVNCLAIFEHTRLVSFNAGRLDVKA